VRYDEHALLEGLVRKLLDDLRDAHFMMARGAEPAELERMFSECRITHGQLSAALPLNVDRARALGYLIVDVLDERIGALRDMARETTADIAEPRPRGRGGVPSEPAQDDRSATGPLPDRCGCGADRSR